MPCTKKVDKPCEDCGVLLVQVAPIRRLCYACAKKRQKAGKKKYNTVKQKERIVLQGSPIPNPNAKYCEGCVYWYGGFDGYELCNYIFCNDHRRPCPPGKDCTEKVIGKRKRSKEFVGMG